MFLSIKQKERYKSSVDFQFNYFNKYLKTEDDRAFIINGAIGNAKDSFDLDLLKNITVLLFFFIQRCDYLEDSYIRELRRLQKLTNKIEESEDLIKLISLLRKNNFKRKHIVKWNV